jgi:hypothetical protein
MRKTTNLKIALERLAQEVGVELDQDGRSWVLVWPNGTRTLPHKAVEALGDLIQQLVGSGDFTYAAIRDITKLTATYIPDAKRGSWEPVLPSAIPMWVDTQLRRVLRHDPENPNRREAA